MSPLLIVRALLHLWLAPDSPTHRVTEDGLELLDPGTSVSGAGFILLGMQPGNSSVLSRPALLLRWPSDWDCSHPSCWGWGGAHSGGLRSLTTTRSRQRQENRVFQVSLDYIDPYVIF